MAHESLGESTLVRALTDLLADLSDLIQKEMRLARAEITQKLTAGFRGGLWTGAAGLLAFVAFLFALEGVVFALASAGVPLQWSCFLVAALIAVSAAVAFYAGGSPADTGLAPRAIRQFDATMRTAKEQLK